jgi:transcription elongation factor Elf1
MFKYPHKRGSVVRRRVISKRSPRQLDRRFMCNREVAVNPRQLHHIVLIHLTLPFCRAASLTCEACGHSFAAAPRQLIKPALKRGDALPARIRLIGGAVPAQLVSEGGDGEGVLQQFPCRAGLQLRDVVFDSI